MTTTSEKILQSIKEAQIRPAPRWKFLAKNWVLWSMFGISLMIGALAFSVFLNSIVNHDWDIYPYLHKTFLQYFILSLPYLWIICITLFAWLAYYNFVHIKGWYRHRVYLVIIASVFLSIGAGIVFFWLGVGNYADHVLSANSQYYKFIKIDRKNLWSHPGDGLLGGKIITIMNDGEFIIFSFGGNQWDVKKENGKLNFPKMKVGENIKIIGIEEGDYNFVAKEIRRCGDCDDEDN